MKKLCHRVSIFLAFLLLLTIVVGIAATAHARACNHVYEEPDVVIEYFYRSTTQHTRRTTTTKVCTTKRSKLTIYHTLFIFTMPGITLRHIRIVTNGDAMTAYGFNAHLPLSGKARRA